MTGLFTLNWREEHALSQIDSVRTFGEARPEGYDRKIYLRGGEGKPIDDLAYRRLAAHPVQLLPAEPGIQALAIAFENGRPVIDKTPVIAWALCFDGSIRIVTPAGVDDGHLWKEGGGYVLMPCGKVQAVTEWMDADSFDSLDAYIGHHAAKQGVKLERAAEPGRQPKLPEDSDPPHIFEDHARWATSAEKVA